MTHEEIVKAWEAGKQIQYYNEISGEWQDCPGYWCLFRDRKFRAKPEENGEKSCSQKNQLGKYP